MTPLQQAAWNKSIRDSVDELLHKGGYNEDSSTRHQLSMMNFDAEAEQAQAVEPMAWVFLPNRELLWPAEVEATNPISIDDYKPLYAHPAGEHVPESAFGNIEQVAVPCPSLCELCIKRGYSACANVVKTTPLPAPLPIPEKVTLSNSGKWYTADQMQEYGKECAAAERERLLQIVYEQSTPFGPLGECIWISVKSQVRHVPKTDWSAA